MSKKLQSPPLSKIVFDRTDKTAVEPLPAAVTFSTSAALSPKRSGGRPTLAEAQLLIERILDVAKAHFLSTGYHDATLERIAAEVGVHKGALYDRYPDKFSLFAEVCARLVTRLYQADTVTIMDDLPMRNSLRNQAIALVAAATNPTTMAFLASY